MAKSERLMDLLQALRRRTRAVTAQTLAEELGVHVRTVYRDILTLQTQGAPIEGEAGIGYVLRPGYDLPPLMFRPGELAALVLGARWVIRQNDPELTQSARDALAKIAAVLPPQVRREMDDAALLLGPIPAKTEGLTHLPLLRKAIGEEKKVRFVYEDKGGAGTERTVWPLSLGFFEQVRILVGWCELRNDFRHFRLDRMTDCRMLPESYPRSRNELRAEWVRKEGINPAILDALGSDGKV